MNPWKLTSLALALVLALVAGLHLTGSAFAGQPQPRMQSAVGFLRSARFELDKATADKGGHRVKAIELTSAAITEVEKGIEFDRTH